MPARRALPSPLQSGFDIVKQYCQPLVAHHGIMRIALASIAACVPMLLAGCHKPQSSNPIAALGEPRIKSIALTSIATKYPILKSSDLRFESMSSVASAGGAAMIEVTYILPASAGEKEQDAQQTNRTTITMKAVRAIMSPSGRVRDVSEGKFAAVLTVTK